MAEELRQQQANMWRHVPIQGVHIEDIEFFELYTVYDEVEETNAAFAPVELRATIDSLEDQMCIRDRIDADPDIILCSFPFREQILSEKESWKDLAAVIHEAVYDLDGDLINRPGPRLVQGLEQLYEIFHPEP